MTCAAGVTRVASVLAPLLLAAAAARCGGTAARDTSTDASPDTSPDTSTDTSTDVSTDTSTDASVDASTESSTDASAETSTESSTDASTDTSTGIASGFGNCATDTVLKVSGGGGDVGMAGSVTLTRSGSVLTVSYGGDGGLFDTSLEFTQTSATSAILIPGQQIDGISVPCAPLEFAPSVAQLQSGSLTFNAGMLFLSVEGTDEAFDAGAGCSNAGGTASVLITCPGVAGAPDGGVEAGSDSDAAPLGSAFVGAYTCVADVINVKAATPMAYESVDGEDAWNPMGQLTITETGGVLTAAYANDSNVAGSLQFVATTESAAVPATTNQTMQVVCNNPWTQAGTQAPSTLPVTSSTLTIDGSYVVLSFAGDMTPSSACPGAESFVSVLCSR